MPLGRTARHRLKPWLPTPWRARPRKTQQMTRQPQASTGPPSRAPRPRPLNATLAAGCWVVLLATLPAASVGQKPKVETYGIADGLPSSEIADLAQDASGRIWILTAAGLASYDGDSFSIDRKEDQPHSELASLAIDPAGRLWTVARWGGPSVYFRQGSSWSRVPPPAAGLPATGELTDLAVVATGERTQIAVGTKHHGLWLWDEAAWTHRGRRDGLPSDTVTALAVVDDTLVVGTTGGLCRARGLAIDCSEASREQRLSDPILALFSTSRPAAPRRLWVLSYDWVGFLEGGELRVVREGLRLPRKTQYYLGSLLVDAAGGVYLGMTQLLLFLAPDSGWLTPLGQQAGLATDGATALLLDRESNAWVGSTRGLSMIDSWRFRSFDMDSGLLEDEVTALVELASEELALGHNSGLTFLDGGGAETVRFGLVPGSTRDASRVMDMAVDGDGEIWVAAHRSGLLRVDRDRTVHAEPPAAPVFSVELDALGRVWVAGRSELFVRENGSFSLVQHGQGDIGVLRWLEASPRGGMYVSTSEGLLWLDDDGWHMAHGPTTEADILYGVLAEESGEVWVGTRGGLYRLHNDHLRKVSRGRLAIDRPVYLILKDTRGRHWFGTDDGVLVWNGSELRHLTVDHGLIGRETNRGAGFVDSRGRVWIGTAQGLSVYQEAYDAPPTAAPLVRISALEVSGQRRAIDGKIRLRARDHTLTFHMRAMAFSREEQVAYRYKLEGLDETWQGPFTQAQPGARYTHVPPGRYRFRAAAGWSAGAWGAEASSPPIEIASPLWRRPWFLTGITMMLAAMVLGAHRLQTRAIRARNLELESLNVKLTESISERQLLIHELESKNAELERFAYTVSHDLKSPLVTISGFLDLVERDADRGDRQQLASDVERIRTASRKMTGLLDELLDLARIGRVSNPIEEVALSELAQEAVAVAARSIAEIGARVRIDPDLPVVLGDRGRLLEVLQNLVENAVKFTGDQPQPRIEIGARRQLDETGRPITVCYVHDNGQGIEPRFHDKVFRLFERLRPETEGSGVGLALVRRIVKFHGGRTWIESEGLGSGTTVCFTIPPAAPETQTPDGPAPRSAT